MAYIRDLYIYNNSLKLSNIIWDICVNWKHFEKDTIGKKLVRSIDSISANIAEGYGRRSIKDNIRFCYYARGSIEETKDWLSKCQTRELIENTKLHEINKQLEIISKELWKYIISLKKQIV